jgi:hypothetical protein
MLTLMIPTAQMAFSVGNKGYNTFILPEAKHTWKKLLSMATHSLT